MPYTHCERPSDKLQLTSSPPCPCPSTPSTLEYPQHPQHPSTLPEPYALPTLSLPEAPGARTHSEWPKPDTMTVNPRCIT